MESVDQQLRQQKEIYEHMTEGELCALAENANDLTKIAREALQAVLSEKGITVRLRAEPLPPSPDKDLLIFGWPQSAEAAGRTMKILAAAGIPSFISLEVRADDVKRSQAALQRVIDDALEEDDPEEEKEFAILSHAPYEDLVIFGWPQSAEAAGRTMKILAAAGIPSFLSLDVRADDVKRSRAALDRAIYGELEKDDPEEEKEFAILCPKCHSAQVVLQGQEPELKETDFTAKFQWRCDACGYQWVDDGMTQEAAGGQSWPGEEFPFRDKDSSEWDAK